MPSGFPPRWHWLAERRERRLNSNGLRSLHVFS
jgi:hypothetical protein